MLQPRSLALGSTFLARCTVEQSWLPFPLVADEFAKECCHVGAVVCCLLSFKLKKSDTPVLLKLSMHNRKDTSSRTDWDTKQDPALHPQLKLASGLGSVTHLRSCTTQCSVQLCWLVSVRKQYANHTHSSMVTSFVCGATYGLVLQCGVPTPPLVPMAN